jgi:hypothetical protein
MAQAIEIEEAQVNGHGRKLWLLAQGGLFVTWQWLFFFTAEEQGVSAADQPRTVTWLVGVLALLLLLGTGGALLRSPAVRALLDDEQTRADCAAAFTSGFWAATAAAILLYLFDLFEPVDGGAAIHLMLSAGIGAAFATFALREIRRTGG